MKLVLLGLCIGVVAGVTSGLLGVGGGIIIVPLLVAFAALSQHQANATSLAAIVPIAAVAATRFALDGRIDWVLAGLLAVGSLAGAPVGARIMSRSSPGLLKTMFGALMIAVALQLLFT
ncbi:MAG: sulfite exporter TauE/SafE family protein [Actinobacteria bacterium]|nr:sulfite exporter TauE/SafE family protein [Actinomycetota bacterium]MDQ3217196.1 sulfite exporter TauE/SafE family protein [Actinomycetota bacterium]